MPRALRRPSDPWTSAEGGRSYWKLLDRFEALTGVPVLLNTSFNIQEPIVCRPEDALATFARSGVDALALGDYWVTRAAGSNGHTQRTS